MLKNQTNKDMETSTKLTYTSNYSNVEEDYAYQSEEFNSELQKVNDRFSSEWKAFEKSIFAKYEANEISEEDAEKELSKFNKVKNSYYTIEYNKNNEAYSNGTFVKSGTATLNIYK